MNNKIWLRSETKEKERRTPLTPADAKKLIGAGAIIHIEDDPQRIFPIDEYKEIGCTIEPAHSWKDAPEDFFILGLKEILDTQTVFRHKHIYFAHVFKGQEGSKDILAAYKRDGGSLFDLEYLTDENNRRIAAFGRWAGFAGAAFALDFYYWKLAHKREHYPALRSFDSIDELMKQIHDHKEQASGGIPKVIIVGAKGRCGQGATEVFEKFDIEVTKWDYEETKGGGPFKEIAAHDLFINAALITTKIPPFIDKETLSHEGRKLSIIADVSCDPNSDLNPIPIYNSHTLWNTPFLEVDLNGSLDILSVDNLPSTLPLESSIDFSEQLLPHLIELVQKKGSLPLPFENALKTFNAAL